ncbi:hypothetical protein D3C84_595620 [compost metagenome]
MVVRLLLMPLPLALQVQQLGRFARVGLGQALAEQAGVHTVTGQQAGRAEDTDGALPLIKALTARRRQLLEIAQADVHADHRDHATVLDDRKGQGGDQRLLPRSVIEVGIQQAGLKALLGAVEPGIERAAVEHGRGVADHVFGHCQGVQACTALCPVSGETALFVTARFGTAGKGGIVAAQRIRFEHEVEAEQLRVGLQRLFDLLVERITQGLTVQIQFLRLATLAHYFAR